MFLRLRSDGGLVATTGEIVIVVAVQRVIINAWPRVRILLVSALEKGGRHLGRVTGKILKKHAAFANRRRTRSKKR